MTVLCRLCLLLTLLGGSGMALAQQSKMFGPYELHYSVVNTTFLSPEVAATYAIVRGKNRGIVTLAVREHLAEGSQTRPMLLCDSRSKWCHQEDAQPSRCGK